MKHLLAVVALLVVIAAGMLYAVNKGGQADRDVPGRTTDARKGKLGN